MGFRSLRTVTLTLLKERDCWSLLNQNEIVWNERQVFKLTMDIWIQTDGSICIRCGKIY
jgi:hypothetical protein